MSRLICMWSGPRNLSTAMMRSFGAREDCAVYDEPFFAPFLKVSGKAHPGRAETLAAHETDPNRVAARCAEAAPNGAAVYFQKHMPHHMLVGFPLDWAASAEHFFLIRHPARVIASYAKGRADFDVQDLGYGPQLKLYRRLEALTGQAPPVIDSSDILAAPEAQLRGLCAALNLSWDTAMLRWDAGRRETDGAWAPYWYASVERSTGFGAPPPPRPDVLAQYRDIYERCLPDYAALSQRKITV